MDGIHSMSVGEKINLPGLMTPLTSQPVVLTLVSVEEVHHLQLVNQVFRVEYLDICMGYATATTLSTGHVSWMWEAICKNL